MADEAEVLSLEELKAKNAAEEKAELEKEQAKQKAEEEQPEDTTPAGDETLSGGEDPPKESDETPAEDWLKPQGEQPQPKFTDSDVAQLRRKLKGKLKETETENENLKKELEELRKQKSQPVSTSDKPNRDAFETDADYQEALAVWVVETRLTKERQQEEEARRKRQREESIAATEEAVESHYERAASLTKSASISAEAFKEADYRVREAIDSVFEKAGDTVTDSLIARMGAGSEKVMYNLGVNKPRRDELVKLLREDPTGIKAAIWLGQLNAQLSAPSKRETKTPTPPDSVSGDKKGGQGQGGKLLRDYKAAHSSGDIQAAVNIKRQAKGLGVDTSKW